MKLSITTNKGHEIIDVPENQVNKYIKGRIKAHKLKVESRDYFDIWPLIRMEDDIWHLIHEIQTNHTQREIAKIREEILKYRKEHPEIPYLHITINPQS